MKPLRTLLKFALGVTIAVLFCHLAKDALIFEADRQSALGRAAEKMERLSRGLEIER